MICFDTLNIKKFVKIDMFPCNVLISRELRFPAKNCSVKIFWPALLTVYLNRQASQPRLSNAPGGHKMDLAQSRTISKKEINKTHRYRWPETRVPNCFNIWDAQPWVVLESKPRKDWVPSIFSSVFGESVSMHWWKRLLFVMVRCQCRFSVSSGIFQFLALVGVQLVTTLLCLKD